MSALKSSLGLWRWVSKGKGEMRGMRVWGLGIVQMVSLSGLRWMGD